MYIIPEIRRNRISNFQFHHISRHDFVGGNGDSLAIASHDTSGRTEGAEGVHGFFSGEVLVYTNDDIENNDSSNEATLDP